MTAPAPGAQRVTIQHDLYVELPDADRHFAIRQRDWNRLKRTIAETPVRPRLLPVVYSVLFGLGGSAGLTIIPLSLTSDAPAWVAPLYVLVTLFSVAGGYIAWRVDKDLGHAARGHLSLVQNDMTDIEATFAREMKPVGLAAGRSSVVGPVGATG